MEKNNKVLKGNPQNQTVRKAIPLKYQFLQSDKASLP